MRIRFQTLLPPLLGLGASLCGFAQGPYGIPSRVPPPSYTTSQSLDERLRQAAAAHYSGWSPDSPSNQQGAGPNVQADRARWAAAQQSQSEYDDYLERKRRREEARREAIREQLLEVQSYANPDAPDQSERLKNAKDRDAILRGFHTMYVDARDAKYFGSDQMKAALGRNKEFQKLNIRIVDDPRMADTVLKVSYTFAWDYPFELRHQNTTYVLLSGKGEGPFSGPLGAADVARQFANAAKQWREEKKSSNH